MMLCADVGAADALEVARLLRAHKAAASAAYNARPDVQRARLADAVADAEEEVREHRHPDEAYAKLRRAKAALAEWDAAHPAEAAAIKAQHRAEREQAEAERKARYEQSFVARGLD